MNISISLAIIITNSRCILLQWNFLANDGILFQYHKNINVFVYHNI
jgi:hypothetical protein